jgi:HAMP domain-containing protein
VARKRSFVNWRAKLAALLVSLILIAVAASTFFALRTQEEVFHRMTLDSLTALAKAKADGIEQFTEDRRRYVERLAPLMASSLTRLSEARRVAEAERLKESTPAQEEEERRPPDLQDAEQIDDPQDADGDSDGEPSDQESQPADAADAPDAPIPAERSAPTDPVAVEEHPAVEEARRALRRTLGLISWDQESFEELIVLDTDGNVIVSTFKGHEGTTAANIEYFKKGLKATYLNPVFRSPITETLTMVISTPIHDDEHDLIGVLVARLNLQRFFRRIGDATGLGETGETVVGKKKDDAIEFTAPTRHDSDAALRRTVPLGAEQGRRIAQAAQGQSGAGEGMDYRGEQVFAAWRHVASIGWGLVVKIDRDEAMRAVDESRRTTAGLAGIIVLIAVVVSLVAAKAFVQPLRELQVAAERISRGDLDVSIDTRSRDEIGDLADSFERMIAAIKFFREHATPADEDGEGPPDAD